VSDANWTDEDSLGPPTKADEPTAKTGKSNVIDRPVQLSSTAIQHTKSQSLTKGSKLKIKPQSLWYTIELPTPSSIERPNAEIMAHLKTRGVYLLQREAEDYMSSNYITSSDRQFLSTIMTSGTQSDRLSALTLSITSSSLHCQKQLDALMNMAKKKSRNEAVQAIAAIKDLLIGNLLPERKLMYFDKQPRLRSDATEQEMILWTFEDWLKGWYYQVLQTIEVYRRVI
jgi:ribosome biogenesis protein MAK21